MIRTLTQPLTYKMGSSIFVAMIRIKVASTTWAYLPIIPLAESTNREFLPLIVAMLPMLVLIDFPHCSKSLPIPYGFQVSASESTNLTSMISSIWISHSIHIDMLPHVSGTITPWLNSSSDLLHPKWIRVSPQM